MSVHYTSAVWRISALHGNAKLLLLSLADQANDEGMCWPSIHTLMERIGVTTQRAVQSLLRDLEDGGYIRREFFAGRATHYYVLPEQPAQGTTAPAREPKKGSIRPAPVAVETVKEGSADSPQGVNVHSSRTVIHPEPAFRGGMNVHSPQGMNVRSSPPAPPNKENRHLEPSVNRQSVRASRTDAAASRGSRLPEGWTPTGDMLTWAAANHPSVDTAAQTEAFCDYWRSKAGAAARKTDWSATWRNWIRRSVDFSGRRSSGGSQGYGAPSAGPSPSKGDSTSGRGRQIAEQLRRNLPPTDGPGAKFAPPLAPVMVASSPQGLAHAGECLR